MKRLLAIAFLTLRAAFRYRLVLVLLLLLLGVVVALPLLIKDDGTARGFTQILMTYTLAAITALLGFTTLWLACGTLAREVEECQLQMVAVKPVARWQIWVGKWLGILMLDAMLLIPSSGAVYGLLMWRAQHLPEAQRTILRNEVLVARSGVKEASRDLEPVVEESYRELLKQSTVAPEYQQMFKDQVREQVKAEFQIVRSGYLRRWEIELGPARRNLKDQPLFIHTKFSVAQKATSFEDTTLYPTVWMIGVPGTTNTFQMRRKLAADTMHELPIPANLFDENGKIIIECANAGDVDLLFLLDDGLEVLYRDGGFTVNFMRGVGIIFCWMALLAAIGLAAASFLSFPVAAFVALGILVVGFSSGTIAQVLEEGGITGVNHDTGRVTAPGLVDRVAVPVFSGLLKVINLVQGFSPIDNLSSGRTISWAQLGAAVLQIVGVMGGIFGGAGIYLFTRRELAAAQGGQ
jgi:hypothetical protein